MLGWKTLLICSGVECPELDPSDTKNYLIQNCAMEAFTHVLHKLLVAALACNFLKKWLQVYLELLYISKLDENYSVVLEQKLNFSFNYWNEFF